MIRLTTFEHALLCLAVKNYAQNKRGQELGDKLSGGYVWIAESDAEDALLIDANADVTESESVDTPRSIIKRVTEPDNPAQMKFDILDAARGLAEETRLPRDLDSDLLEDR